MKKVLLSSALLFGLVSSLSAYELNGKLGVKWTGFKTEKKAPVSGSFNDIKIQISSSKDLLTFLKSAKVTIVSDSFESKNPVRNKNITSTLFSLASSKIIKGSITKVDESMKKLILKVTMNEVSKDIPMNYRLEDGNIVAEGVLDILDFDMKSSFMAFAKKCAAFHQNKSYSDVNIEFTLPYK
jgi:polyisoprenoid-binding protein YceI